MLLVIAYPVYYTVYLSFFNTPPNLAMEDKIWVGLDNYDRILHERERSAMSPKTPGYGPFFPRSLPFVSGFGAALVLNREFVGRGLCAASCSCPM